MGLVTKGYKLADWKNRDDEVYAAQTVGAGQQRKIQMAGPSL